MKSGYGNNFGILEVEAGALERVNYLIDKLVVSSKVVTQELVVKLA